MSKLELLQGCVFGSAVGDALGAKWEGVFADMIYQMGPADAIVAHDSNETIYYSDDTQMMIGVLQTLMECRTIDVNHLARAFVANYHPDRGYGQGARKIINAIAQGEDWQIARQNVFEGAGSFGNGGAMRVGPIGVLFADDLERVAEQADLSAQPTHSHEIGVDGARLVALAVALAARSHEQRFDQFGFLSNLRSFAKTEEFQWQLGHALQLKPFDSLICFGNSLEAHRSVVTSIMCFVDSPDDYCQAISRAIGQGNDVDTLAAMTGAISGARLGISAIPQRLISCLEDEFQGRTYLWKLTDDIAAKMRN